MEQGRLPRRMQVWSWCVFLTPMVATAAPVAPAVLPEIVVVAGPGDPSVPASRDWVSTDVVAAWPRERVSDLFRRIPGVAARDRQNLAQDLQLTVRGFGARTTFGVRGLRIFVDGIPATMPDGQGQLSHVPLASLESVEVLRGPFSALYGNAAGGVIRFSTKSAAASPEMTWASNAGGDARNASIDASGPWRKGDDGGYRLDAERMDSDGFRDHSKAKRDVRQAQLSWHTRSGSRITLTANDLDLSADDPQGLTSAEAREDPRAASAAALLFDTRKTVQQAQVGFRWSHEMASRDAIGDPTSSWSFDAYAGNRATWQMLSIPVQAQAAPGSGGGVVDLDRHYGGADLRGTWQWQFAGRPLELAAGIEWQRSAEHRRGYENFAGDTLGIVGALRRDQMDISSSRDAYAELHWGLTEKWRATLGLRHSSVGFDSNDHYIVPGNPDDSGELSYSFTTPVFGLLYRPAKVVELYADAGRGFETPSGSELAYRPDGASGLNDSLRPARTHSVEIGLRLHRGAHEWSAAAFDAQTQDELVVASNLGGRSTYANAGRTQRSGLELSASGPLGERWHYALVWTTLAAHTLDHFTTCRAPPCGVPDTLVPAGSRIPGTAARSGWAELRWSPRDDLDLVMSGQGFGRTWADDLNSSYAPGYATFDMGLERRWRVDHVSLTALVRVENLFDRSTIGSVIVNESNGRYFEPAPGRSLVVGVRMGISP